MTEVDIPIGWVVRYRQSHRLMYTNGGSAKIYITEAKARWAAKRSSGYYRRTDGWHAKPFDEVFEILPVYA